MSQFKFIVKLVLSFGLLAFFLWKTGIDHTLAELASANLWYVPIGVGIYLFSQTVSAYRWQFLAKALNFNLSVREYFDYYMMGMFFSLFLPGAIGGDVGRMYYLAKSANRKKREAMLTVLAERGVGMAAILIIAGVLLATPVTESVSDSVRWVVWALCAGFVGGFAVLQMVPIERIVEKFPKLGLFTQAKVYWQDKPLFIKSVAISFLVHSCILGLHMAIAVALGIGSEVPVLYMATVYGIVSLVSALPIFFNGIGVREGAYQLMLGYIGIPPETALAFGLYWFLISTLTSLIGGLILVKGHYKTPPPQEAELTIES
ncbi:MAG: flippase-like domain-containing protein [Vampirovibrio sp.]|nr:flippase-like domain-containing protein [Vampirovibrio sp.]